MSEQDNSIPEAIPSEPEKKKPRQSLVVLLVLAIILGLFLVLVAFNTPTPNDNQLEGTQPILPNDTCTSGNCTQLNLASASSDINIQIVGGK